MLDYLTPKSRVSELGAKFKRQKMLIENRGSGTHLIRELKANGLYGVVPYDPPSQTDKIMRLHAQTDKFEAGRVLLPSSAPWLADFIQELTTFPGTKFDDQVDAITQALDYLSQYGSVVDLWARLAR